MFGEVDCFILREEREFRFSGFFPLEARWTDGCVSQLSVLRSCIVLILDFGDGKMALLYVQSKILFCERHGLG